MKENRKETVTMKLDVVKVIKIVSTACSLIGMIGSTWANGKETTRTIETMVNKQFEQK